MGLTLRGLLEGKQTMMELKDFERFLEFTRRQITILKEKERNVYKNDSWKLYDEEDLYDSMVDQIDAFDYTQDKAVRQRKALHIANYAWFLYEKQEDHQ